MKRTLYIPVLAAAALLAVACQSEPLPEGEVPGGESILCFQPALGGSFGTKSNVDNGGLTNPDTASLTKDTELVATDGSIAIPLTCTVSDGIGEPAASQTKGTQQNTSGDWDALGEYVDKFYVAAWKGGSSFIPADTEVTKGTPLWKTSTDYRWAATEDATFYAYANLPESGATIDASSSAQTLEHTVPTASSAQQDILMGYYQGTPGYDETLHKGGIAEVKFYHPLTAVRFKKGSFEGFTDEQVEFKSISIKGVYTSGTATMNPTTMLETDCGDFFDWDTEGSSTQTVTMTPESGTSLTVDANGFIGDTFLLIPQTMTTTAPVTISAVVNLNGTEKNFDAKLESNSWEAGKTNIYTLGTDSNTYEYTFTFSDGTLKKYESVIENASNDKFFSYDLSSSKKNVGTSITEDQEWTILRYKLDGEYANPVNASSFTDDATGITVTADNTTNKLNVKVGKREIEGVGTNDYWINKDNRTDNLEWSPKSWGSEAGGLNKGTIDLSKFNFQTEVIDAHAMTTSNCYIIRHAGTYMLPLVYGNGVVGGSANTVSYAPATDGLTPFQNHLGQGIVSPYIENNAGCTAVEAAVVWQDKAEVIKNLEIVDGASSSDVRYLKFEIAQNDIRQCNAIIAIKDGTGTDANIIWSWHIWITNNPALLDNSIPVTNISGNIYKFFPMYSLGWIDNEKYRVRKGITVILMQNGSGKKVELTVDQPDLPYVSHGTFYQWGRKDPMCSSDTPAVGNFNKQSGKVSMATAIRNPNIMYYTTISSGEDWCDISYNNLWTGVRNNNTISEQESTMIKTIYDPSPVGYKIPAIKAFSGFTIDGKDSYVDIYPGNTYFERYNVTSTEDNYTILKGWYFYTRPNLPGKDSSVPSIFFPALGYRNFTNADFVLEGQNTGYWSANTVKSISGAGLHFRDKYLLLTNGYSRTFGCSVRPVIDPTMSNNPIQ